MHCSSSMTNPARHGGAVLLMTFIAAIVIGGLLAMSSESTFGVRQMQKIGNARQQAIYAAEAVAAMKEVEMVNLAATNDLTGLDSKPDPNFGNNWFGNCQVRWRIEPIRIANADGSYTVNPVANANVLPPGGDYLNNFEFYTYRIATEADYLADPNDATATPWDNPEQRVCSVQASRVVQLRLNSLFKYAIFYAAEGNTGDLEMWVGSSISVAGAVHSNGAIYIGGQGNQYLSGNYHNASSLGGAVTIGGANANRVTVTGIDGIFRMRKGVNTLAFRNPAHPLYDSGLGSGIPDPFQVPPDIAGVDDNGVMGGADNLNGDTPGSSTHKINNINFTSSRDSRSPDWITSSPFGQYVRDSQKGAMVVKTLANIPELAGRPFESQKLVGPGQALYFKDPLGTDADPANNTQYTVNPTANSKPLYYQNYAGNNFAPTTDGTGRIPILAENMKLYSFAGGVTDVWPDNSAPPLDAITSLPSTEARGYYLSMALQGKDGGLTTGLVIRERGAQRAAFFAGAKPARAAWAAGAAGDAAYRTAYANYMKSQYQVRLFNVDITVPFFNAILAAAVADTDFIAREEQFVNMREATAMDVFYNNVNRAAFVPAGQPYKVHVLDLNLAQIQSFLKNTNWSALDAAYVGAAKAKDKFNGLIYAHRTRRSLTYDPLLRPKMTFNKYANNATYTLPAAANYPHLVREGNGPIETFHCAIRLSKASDINWNHVAGANPLGTSGLTVVTPNMCYLQGDYNTVSHPDAGGVQRIAPCAIFADGATALSNAWLDSAHQTAATALTAATATTFNLSFVINNVPTDDLNCVDEGSGAVSNVVRYLENWGGVTYSFKGSLVVMNRMRYSYTSLGANPCALNMNTAYYSPPNRVLQFNTDLLTKAGQPPFTPFGVQVIRTVSTLADPGN